MRKISVEPPHIKTNYQKESCFFLQQTTRLGAGQILLGFFVGVATSTVFHARCRKNVIPWARSKKKSADPTEHDAYRNRVVTMLLTSF